MNKKRLWLFTILFAGAVAIAQAQQQAKVPRIGFLSGSGDLSNPATSERAFRQGLSDLGYVDGKNIMFEVRYAQGNRDRIPTLVEELVQLKVDVFLTGNLTAIRVAKQITQTLPIVMVTNADPVAIGLVDSLARPGGNITGITNLNRDLNAKRLELLKEILPNVSRVGVLWDPTNEGSAIGFREYETAAQPMKIQLQSLEVRGPSTNLESTFQAAVKGRCQRSRPDQKCRPFVLYEAESWSLRSKTDYLQCLTAVTMWRPAALCPIHRSTLIFSNALRSSQTKS